jgi:hypothetical protein
MVIEINKIVSGEPKELLLSSNEGIQVKVSCQGDIAVQTFGPDKDTFGIAWLLLTQGESGEPGRKLEVQDPMMLSEQPGVVIGAKDPRSLDVLIEALDLLRCKLNEQSQKRLIDDEVASLIAHALVGSGEWIFDAGVDLVSDSFKVRLRHFMEEDCSLEYAISRRDWDRVFELIPKEEERDRDEERVGEMCGEVPSGIVQQPWCHLPKGHNGPHRCGEFQWK